MKKYKKWFPFEIRRNPDWFAEAEWLLYKWFSVTRKHPCGHGKKSDHWCCMQPYKLERVYFTENRQEVICKVCGRTRILSSEPLNPNNPWDITYREEH